ncbi:MAG: hypothetical protein HXY41_01885 [Chloroflexi bacterium]|nr:hypothetical protein [Chloroflexota bacterium]
MSRRFMIALLTLGVLLFRLTAAAAQAPGISGTSVPCEQMGILTDSEILIDIEGSVPSGARGINCTVNVVNAVPAETYFAGRSGDNREVGTPRLTRRIPLTPDQYVDIYDSVDIFTISSGGKAIYGWFSEPVRVCFGVSAEDAAGGVPNTADPFDPANDFYVVFSDARYFQDAKGVGNNQPSRNLQVLNIVPEGLALDYICADIDVPGTVSLVNGLNPAADLAAQQPPADRCAYAGQSDCKD